MDKNAEVLKKIFDEYGRDVMKYPERLLSLISDLSKDHPFFIISVQVDLHGGRYPTFRGNQRTEP